MHFYESERNIFLFQILVFGILTIILIALGAYSAHVGSLTVWSGLSFVLLSLVTLHLCLRAFFNFLSLKGN